MPKPEPQQATWEAVPVTLSVTVTLTVRQTVSGESLRKRDYHSGNESVTPETEVSLQKRECHSGNGSSIPETGASLRKRECHSENESSAWQDAMNRVHCHDGCGIGVLVELAQALAAHGRMRPLFLALGGHLGGRCRLRAEAAPRARAVQGPVVMGGGGGRRAAAGGGANAPTRAHARSDHSGNRSVTPETGVSLRRFA